MVSAMNKKTLSLLAVALTVATVLTAATAIAADNQQPGVSQSVADGNQLSSEALLRLKLKRKYRISQPPTEPPPDTTNPDAPGSTYPQVKLKFLPKRMAR